MKSAALALLLAFGALAQTTRPVVMSNPSVPKAKQWKIAPGTFRELEKHFDMRLETLVNDPAEPTDVLGPTRGIYIDGFGVVYTAEISLVKTPELSPFLREIPKELADRIHKRRVERLPLLKAAMDEMLHTMARAFFQIPSDQQVVLSVRLLYGSWENTVGMPAQIMMRGSRADVQLKKVVEEVQ